jgi:tripartite-type tricarboxylate transporter receptor subunit TctC
MPRRLSRRVVVLALVGATSVAVIPAAARADDFPARTVTIISPYQAGGTSDIIARILAQKLSTRWGKPVIVENRPGANGGIGVVAVAHAAADGHTLLAVASSALTINPLLYARLSYDVARDLAPITRTGAVPNVLVVHPSVPAHDVPALIALAKAKPGTVTYASQGNGSNGHVTGELFGQRAGIDMLHVPYKGSAPAVQDLLGGQVQAMFDNLPTVLPLIRAGQLRALAVTALGFAAGYADHRGSRPARLRQQRLVRAARAEEHCAGRACRDRARRRRSAHRAGHARKPARARHRRRRRRRSRAGAPHSRRDRNVARRRRQGGHPDRVRPRCVVISRPRAPRPLQNL